MNKLILWITALLTVFMAIIVFPFFYLLYLAIESFGFFTGYFKGVKNSVKKHVKGGGFLGKTE